MRTVALGTALVLLMFGTQGVAAQQPKQQMQMRVMDSMNARLDSLVLRMNRASGNAKVSAMAQVINELVAQRRTMHQHMRQMMQSDEMMHRHRMMKPHSESAPAHPSSGAASADSNHAEHHPEK